MKAWLTPDLELLSNPQDCRKIAVPGDLWYLVQGALELLCIEQNWEQYGDATPEQMAQYFMGIVDGFGNSLCSGGGMGMVFLEDIDYPIIESFYYNGNGTFSFVTGDLPIEAQAASALYVSIGVQVPAGGVSVLIDDGSNNARQRMVTDDEGMMIFGSFLIPNPARFIVSPLDSTARSIVVYLVGWIV